MKRLFLALALLLIPSASWAQCNGVFPNNTICGNITGAGNLPRPTAPTAFQGGAAGTNGQIQYNNNNVLGGASGDCTAITGSVICTKTNNVAFAPSATTDTTSASNISSGTLNYARLPISNGAVSGASTTYTSAQCSTVVTRSNTGSAMVDTIPGTVAGVLPAKCVITVLNTDTSGILAISVASGATLNGGLKYNGFIYIGPGQSYQFQSDGSNYWTLSVPSRAKLGANTTILIATTGNDATANGLTTAFLTTNAAWTFAQNVLDHNGFVVTYSHAAGNYALNTTLTGIQTGSCGPACDIIQGNTTTPANVTYGAATGVQLTLDGIRAQVQGFQFNPVTGQSVVATDNAVINWQSNITQASSGASVTAVNNAVLRVIGNYQVGTASSSNETVHWNANNGGRVSIEAAGITITIVGSPAWATAFALAQSGGGIFFDFVPTFSGTSSGTKCSATINGVVNTAGNSASLPGSVACTSSTGGQVN